MLGWREKDVAGPDFHIPVDSSGGQMNHPVVGRQWQQGLSAASPILPAATFLPFPVRLKAVSVPQTDWAENPLQLTSTRSRHACCPTAVIQKLLVFVHPPPPPPKVCSLCLPMGLWVLRGSFLPLCATSSLGNCTPPPKWSSFRGGPNWSRLFGKLAPLPLTFVLPPPVAHATDESAAHLCPVLGFPTELYKELWNLARLHQSRSCLELLLLCAAPLTPLLHSWVLFGASQALSCDCRCLHIDILPPMPPQLVLSGWAVAVSPIHSWPLPLRLSLRGSPPPPPHKTLEVLLYFFQKSV